MKNFLLVISNKTKKNKILQSSDILKIKDINVIKTNSLYEGIELLNSGNEIDMIITNYVFKDANATTLFQELKKSNLFVPVIVVLDETDAHLKTQALVDGAVHVLINPINEGELLLIASNLLNLQREQAHLKASEGIIEALSKSLDYKDNLTKGHAKRVAETSLLVYDALGYKDHEERYKLYIGCLLHDIGKVGVPDNILKSTEVFDKDGPEFTELKKHPRMGFEMSLGVHDETVLDIVLNHHEKLDGSGYPRGLEAKDLSVTVRIVTIVDIYDSLIHKRTYREKMSPEKAFGIIEEEALNDKVSYDIYKVFRNLYSKDNIINELAPISD